MPKKTNFCCLMLETTDKRRFFTYQKNYDRLVEFAQVFGGEISVVNVRKADILDLQALVPALCNPEPQERSRYELVSKKVKGQTVFQVAKKVRDSVRKDFLAGKVVELNKTHKRFSRYGLSLSTVCNHVSVVRKELAAKGIGYIDAGVSGGIWGLERGYCIMTGGTVADFARVEPFIKTLCADKGYLHCGPHGCGHFVKMAHNGIEYAMMEAYGEGFEILNASQYGGELDMPAIAALWNRGSVVRSWLLELLESALKKDPALKTVEGYVEDSGEGRWTVEQAVETGVPAHAISAALFKRFSSRQHNAFSDRILAALRREFGGHAVKTGEGK